MANKDLKIIAAKPIEFDFIVEKYSSCNLLNETIIQTIEGYLEGLKLGQNFYVSEFFSKWPIGGIRIISGNLINEPDGFIKARSIEIIYAT
jgi:hypothetical protein